MPIRSRLFVACFALCCSCLLQTTGRGAIQEDATATDRPANAREVAEMWKAARDGNLEAIKAAVEAGVDVDSPTDYGATALFFACDRGHEDIVKFVLENGADPNARDTFYNATAMGRSLGQDNKNIIVLMIKHGGEGAGGVFLSAVDSGEVDFTKSIIETGVLSKDQLVRARELATRQPAQKNREEILALFEQLELPEPAEVPPLDAESIKRYEGKFKAPRFTVSVAAEELVLRLGFGEGEKMPLLQLSETEFLLGNRSLRYEFEDGKVKTLHLNLPGRQIAMAPVSEAKGTASDMPNSAAVVAESKPEVSESKADAEPKFGPSSAKSLAADLAVSDSNWPGFRGNGARGVAEGQHPPVEWNVIDEETSATQSDTESESDAEPKEGIDDASSAEPMPTNKNLRWKADVPGLGLSCPTIWGDNVYLTTAVPASPGDDNVRIGLYGDVDSVEDSREYFFQVVCYCKTDGALKWKRTAIKSKPAVKRHAKSSHANSTIATDGKHVVAFFGSEGLYCYSSDGDLKWKTDFGLLDSGWFYDPGYQWGFASSPTIFNGTVFVQCDHQGSSFLSAIDLESGVEIWRSRREEIPSWSSPTVHDFGGGPMLLTAGTKAARGYDALTGSLLWSLKKFSEIVVPTPFVAHDRIFVASGYSPIQPIYAIEPDARGEISLDEKDPDNDSIAWGVKRGGPYMPTPIAYGDYLYTCANNGILTCYVAKTGEQVYKKRMRIPGGPLAFSASPLAADGHLYFFAEDGRCVVVKAGSEYDVIATNHCNDIVLATPAISDGVVYIRSRSHLIAVGE